MTIFERVLGGSLFYDFWKQLRQYVFSENRLIQLLTLKPIDIYHTETELEIDTAKVKLYIQAHLENLMQRRIDRTINLLTFNFTDNSKNTSTYDFDVIIKAVMPYPEVSKFFNHHFAAQTYVIEEGKYDLYIDSFHFGQEGTKMMVEMPFVLNSHRWFWKKNMRGTALFSGSLNVHQPRFVVKTRNLQYVLEDPHWVLTWIDRLYHQELLQFLQGFLQYNFKEELFHAKVEAQEQINSFQSQSNWINGHLSELDLERLTIEPDGVHAYFLAKGKLQLLR